MNSSQNQVTVDTSVYIPMDRRQALARNETLPRRTTGTALFADISGFTPLTEALTRTLGTRRGAEELTRQLNQVYDALIAEVDRYHGSVIGFSGDAITCWFDGEAGPQQALAAAQAMQQAMNAFAAIPVPDGGTVSLAVKTALASGPVRRFLVGDPAVHLLDALAGATLQRMSHAEHVANRGEIVADVATVDQLGDSVQVSEWRTLTETPDAARKTDVLERYAVLTDLSSVAASAPWPPLPPLSEEQVRPWLLPAVYERLNAGLDDFLTELRPAVALFLRFSGIDYDTDEDADVKLSTYIEWVQSVLTRFEGILVDLTIGDKGSYLYAAFGAPIAHEDDAQRAVSTALALCAPPETFSFIEPVQIGVSQGMMRTGACGGTMRRTYAILGDEVNLAARLMQNATPGQVLVSQHVRDAADSAFEWETLPPIRVKGKRQTVPVARPVRERQILVDFSSYKGTLIGRETELAQLNEFLQPIFEGRLAGVASVYGEAGMGKSRLIYELHQRLSHPVRWLTCPAEQILRQSLSVFKTFLRDYFGQEAHRDEAENKARFELQMDALLIDCTDGALHDELERRRSFLGALIDLHWPNSAYEQLEPKLRFENTQVALRALILAESKRQSLILQVEDAHWLDSDSQQVLQMIVQNAADYPLAILISSRYWDDGRRLALNIPPEVPQQVIALNQLTPAGIRAMATQSLNGAISDDLAALLAEKTNGNPFFVEQLALDLRERGLLSQSDGLWTIQGRDLPEVPAGINAVLIARLDRLEAHVKAVVQVASVVGHEFEVRVLAHMLQEDQQLIARVQQAETEAIWSALSEAQYLFRHALLRDAAYAMQLQQHLRQWHALAGGAIEQLYAADLAARAASLAYHFGRAEDRERERHYSRMAGERAAAAFANSEAAAFLSRALELTTDPTARYELLLAREKTYDLMGDAPAQEGDLDVLQALAESLNDDRRRIEVWLRRASHEEYIGSYGASVQSAAQAAALADVTEAVADRAAAHYQLGRALWRQAENSAARVESERALALAREGNLAVIEARTLLILGNIAFGISDYPEARRRYEEALTLRRRIGDRQGEAITLNNLGSLALRQGDLSSSADYSKQSLEVAREIGDRRTEGIALSNLGNLSETQGDEAGAQGYYEQALKLSRATGDRRSENIALNNLSEIAVRQGDYAAARTFNERALTLSRQIEDRFNEVVGLAFASLIALQTGDHGAAYQSGQQMSAIARDIDSRFDQARALTLIGHAALNDRSAAASAYREALTIQTELGQTNAVLESTAGLARLALLSGDVAAALEHIETIWDKLQGEPLEGMDDPFRVYLISWQVLDAAKDGRVGAFLERTYRLLQKQAERFSSDEARRHFLEDVPSHRELVRAWEMQK